MFHKAINLSFREGTTLELTFQDGVVKQYDMSELFSKYPQLIVLEDRDLFLSARLASPYGIIWNDDLDIEAETIYEEGTTVRTGPPVSNEVGDMILAARAKANLSQKQLSSLTGIDQSDISKIERGLSNPSVSTLDRIAKALGGKLEIRIEVPDAS